MVPSSVRVPQLRHCSGLAQKSISNISISCELWFDDFDRNRTFETEMRCAIDCAHPTSSYHSLYTEPAGDKLRDIHT